jgi:hypothetical protein
LLRCHSGSGQTVLSVDYPPDIVASGYGKLAALLVKGDIVNANNDRTRYRLFPDSYIIGHYCPANACRDDGN